MKSSTFAFLAIISTSLFFSLPPILTKLLYRSFEPISLVFLRFSIASICILPLFLAQRKEISLKMILKIIPISLFSSINILLFSIGISRTTASSSTIIYTDIPFLVAILSYFILKERLGRRKIAGIILGFLGICLITILPLFQKGQIGGDVLGNLLILIATLSWAIYMIGSSRLTKNARISPIMISSVSFFTSTIVFLVGSLIFAKKDFITPIFLENNLMLLLALGSIATVGSYVLMQWTIKHSSATVTSLHQYIQPVFTITLASIFLKETISVEFISGAVLVFTGVLIATGAGGKIFKKLKF